MEVLNFLSNWAVCIVGTIVVVTAFAAWCVVISNWWESRNKR